MALFFIGGSRMVWRWYWERHRRPDADRARRTIVFGAGEGGSQMVKAMQSDPDSDYAPVAMLDDNPDLANREVAGVRVEGTRSALEAVANRYDAEVLLIAITRANSTLIQELTAAAVELGLEVRVLPATSELVGRMTVADVRPPTVDDLLGRDPVEIDDESVREYLRDRRVLITGAGGSIGSELSRQVASFEPGELILLDRDETALHSLQLSMEGRALLDSDRLVVADIRDRDRMFEVFELFRPEVVFHAAALKHLTLLENHPMEGVKTNVLGTRNVLDAAVEAKVERFVNVSTDKAANPTSVLGATKLAAERLTAQVANETDGIYVSVRFGNVLGSRGSVLPTFLKQIEQGVPLTVTDPDATRFFMTIPEASRLVVQAAAIGDPGEIMILDMGKPVRIDDLAKKLVSLLRPGTPIEYTGLRTGEKLHEDLMANDEIGTAKTHPRIIHTIVADTSTDVFESLDAATRQRIRSLLEIRKGVAL
jgi:FlaA1/EpsC-like NDP-sugar epimerase